MLHVLDISTVLTERMSADHLGELVSLAESCERGPIRYLLKFGDDACARVNEIAHVYGWSEFPKKLAV